MSRLLFEQKLVGETRTYFFDFSSKLGVGEIISSASTSATLYSGSDGAAAILNGAATISSPIVAQSIKAGVAGCTYILVCTILTSAGQSLSLSGFLAVQADAT